jgi:hypothetical protein
MLFVSKRVYDPQPDAFPGDILEILVSEMSRVTNEILTNLESERFFRKRQTIISLDLDFILSDS